MENNITKNTNNNFYITLLIILCTSLIILTNYVSSQNTAKSIHNQIMQIEYNKIGGKDNYDILRELQKKEVLTYLETIKKEKPELIKEIKNKLRASAKNYSFLNNSSIENLKKDTYIKGNTGALISIVEFSDLECEYCIDFHKSNILNDINTKYSEKTNYIFKNFPLPTHKNSKTEAEYATCVKNLSDGETYLDFVDMIFNTTTGGGEGIELSQLDNFADELNIEKNELKECVNNKEDNKLVENEFNQGIELGINSVPSTIILNNETGEYVLLKENSSKESIEKIILDFTQE